MYCVHKHVRTIIIVLGVKETSLMDIGSSNSQSNNNSSGIEGKQYYEYLLKHIATSAVIL